MNQEHDADPADAASDAPRAARVPGGLAGRRFGGVLAVLFAEWPRSRPSAWLKSGDVLLDGAEVRPREPVRAGQEVLLPATLETQVRAEPEDIPLSILH